MESKIKVDIVLCTPGSRVSMDWHLRILNLCAGLSAKGLKVFVASAKGHNIYIVRNSCLRFSQSKILSDRIDQKPFNGEIDYKYMVWIDSDNLIEPQQVERLISHDVDIVAGWYKGNLAVGEQLSEDMNRLVCGYWSEVDQDYITYIMKDFLALPRNEKGLVEVDWTGFGLICFKNGVFESLDYPWFYPQMKFYDNVTCCKIYADDIGICKRINRQGFKIFVDASCRILHEKEIAI